MTRWTRAARCTFAIAIAAIAIAWTVASAAAPASVGRSQAPPSVQSQLLLSASSQAADAVEPVRLLIRAARFSEAETEARRVLADVEAASGAASVAAAAVLDVLVEALYRGGRARLPETTTLAERALAINEAHLPATQAEVARSLVTLGTVLRLTGDYAGARTRLDRALAIQEQILPARDPAIANTLDAIGLVLERQGDNPGAERLLRQALEIREQALGAAHPDVATTLNNLGNVESNMGRYAEARTLHERALRIREQALGADHPDVAAALNNLAVDARDLGDHAAAWWVLERVLGIYEKTIGPSHPTIGLVHHNLATILLDLGDADGTRLLAERARRLRGRPSLTTLTPSLTPLVGGTPPPAPFVAARELFERALTIKEAAWGPDHPSVGVTVTSLANVLSHLKEWDRAAPLYERALAIRERALGPNHPDVADTLDRIGEFLVAKGDDRAAKPVFERVLSILEGVYGPDHPHVGKARQHLSMVLARVGDADGALRMALETERIGRDHLRAIGATLPERDALTYAAERPIGLDIALTLVARDAARLPPSSRSAVWDSVVRSRAVVLDHMARRHRQMRAHGEPGVTRLIDNLSSTRDRLARLVVSGPGSSPETYRVELARAREARDAAERALAERSVTFQQEQSQRRIGLDDVRAALPRGSALLAFVRYEQQPTRPVSPHPNRPPRPAESAGGALEQPKSAYLAFIVRAGEQGEPVPVPLGPAAAIDSAIARWRKQITAVAFAGGRSTVRAEAALRQSGETLRAHIWAPLARHLAGTRRIFIVPDGPLHLVNWDALPASTSISAPASASTSASASGSGVTYLIEQAPLFHYVSAERDLVHDAAPSAPSTPSTSLAQKHGLLIVDNPVFDKASGFDALPASAREADTIAAIWRTAHRADGAADVDVFRLSGRAATEAEFKRRAASARVLHLATHGFFLGSGRRPPSADENPLLRAGFALTGAGRRRSAHVGVDGDVDSGVDGTRYVGDEDGMLTAEEIASLDLSAVEWAVLSACDTGVGEVRAGEGVFGLRRAFHVAGARTVIMSLWPVDDEDALRWMTSVYDRRFRRGAGTLEAVRASSLEQLRRRRKNGQSTHPFYWAAFIAAGDWR